MGKIRVKSFGDQEEEKKAVRRSEKRAEKKAKKQSEAESAFGGNKTEEVSSAGLEEAGQTVQEVKTEQKTRPSKKAKFVKTKENLRSQNYTAKAALVDPKQLYSVSEGLKLLEQAHMARFDETVELHINTLTGGVSGSMTLPHASGKTTKVAIVDDPSTSSGQAMDDLIKEIESGKIDFDILIAHPSAMPKLAKVAKVLGPKGLMPNPKNGTITPIPEEVAKKYEGGLINFKTEAKAPIIHLSVGKLSLGQTKLEENIAAAIAAVRKSNIKDITLKSTMSPAIKLKV